MIRFLTAIAALALCAGPAQLAEVPKEGTRLMGYSFSPEGKKPITFRVMREQHPYTQGVYGGLIDCTKKVLPDECRRDRQRK